MPTTYTVRACIYTPRSCPLSFDDMKVRGEQVSLVGWHNRNSSSQEPSSLLFFAHSLTILHPFHTLGMLLYYCITVLLYYCITVLLYYCITVLLAREVMTETWKYLHGQYHDNKCHYRRDTDIITYDKAEEWELCQTSTKKL